MTNQDCAGPLAGTPVLVCAAEGPELGSPDDARESNRGRLVWFVRDPAELEQRLGEL